ncbi:MAG TPA: PHB depolymerase family esterase [Polyangia bacterium]|nr:PHB depolymerase family esterase [Polyangia bacterium]
MPVLVAALWPWIGCAGTEAGDADGPDDSFLADGKADSIQENTPEALGVLAVASALREADLRAPASAGGAGLASRSADGILAFRRGSDGIEGTGDDKTFRTLRELDAVPYVGPRTFAKLLAYARSHDLVRRGVPGSFSDQTLEVGGETRYFYLHVPPGYDPSRPWPLLIDFHGTATISESSVNTPAGRVEEFYALSDLIQVADEAGFMVARPRSRADAAGSSRAYRWDENPGDVGRNVAFTRVLVAVLQARYNVDPSRLYAAGFSSGTNQALQLIADHPPLFRGYAAIGGGIWTPPARSDFGADAPRIYLATGFRDYMFRYLRDLYFYLDSHAFPFQSKIFFRKSDAGHELYGWHYRELFDWLDRGAAPLPAPGTADGWTLETTLPATDGLLHLARAGDGNLIGAAANGQLWRRIAATGAWTQAATISNAEGVLSPMSSVCMLPSGHGVAVGGDGMVALTDDQGASWRAAPPAPDAVPPSGFGYSYLTALGCTGNRVVGTGYWAASVSDDAGLHWMAGSMSNFGFAAQGAAVAPGPSGTWIAVGYWNYIGRSIDGVSFELRNAPQAHEWWNGVASAPGGHWWVVGDQGGILASSDDGQTWTLEQSPRTEDLYAVDFADADHGMAVGIHGTALYTSNGGVSWREVSIGQDLFLGDVRSLGDGTFLAVGQSVFRYRPL